MHTDSDDTANCVMAVSSLDGTSDQAPVVHIWSTRYVNYSPTRNALAFHVAAIPAASIKYSAEAWMMRAKAAFNLIGSGDPGRVA
eukprot:3095670-Pleurochrysis_carterae.AAC.6